MAHILLGAVQSAMPHYYPLDGGFAEALPAELGEIFDGWTARSRD